MLTTATHMCMSRSCTQSGAAGVQWAAVARRLQVYRMDSARQRLTRHRARIGAVLSRARVPASAAMYVQPSTELRAENRPGVVSIAASLLLSGGLSTKAHVRRSYETSCHWVKPRGGPPVSAACGGLGGRARKHAGAGCAALLLLGGAASGGNSAGGRLARLSLDRKHAARSCDTQTCQDTAHAVRTRHITSEQAFCGNWPFVWFGTALTAVAVAACALLPWQGSMISLLLAAGSIYARAHAAQGRCADLGKRRRQCCYRPPAYGRSTPCRYPPGGVPMSRACCQGSRGTLRCVPS